MSKIKGSGCPTRKTAGGVGDIYMDVSTGKRYKCTNAYGVAGEYDYQWKPMTGPFGKTTEEPKEEKVETPKQAPVETKTFVEEKVETKKVEEVKAEEPAKSNKKQKSQKKSETPAESAVETNSKKVDYAAAYKPKTEQ